MPRLPCAVVLGLLLSSTALGASAGELPNQVSKSAQCVSDGVKDTAQYRSYVMVPGTGHFMPIYTSMDLSQPLQVDSVLIMVHGIGGNANTFFCDALKAVGGGSVGVVAPFFGDASVRLWTWDDKARSAARDITSLYWSGGEWNYGAAAANADSIASFAALDAVVAAVASASRGRVKQIVVAGFSAGAQLVQRYAWATAYGAPGSPGPAVKFVVSDPSTFLYFDDRRPAPACRPLSDTGSAGTCSTFVRPSAADSPADYNNYRLGLQDLAASSPYFAQARIASNPDALSKAYLDKQILYIFGAADTCNCMSTGYHNPGHCIKTLAKASDGCHKSNQGPNCCDMPNGKRTNSFVTVKPGEMLQGSNRLQRGLLFTSYLKVFSGGKHTPQVVVVPGMGHDQGPMLNSAAFRSFVSSA